MRVLALRGAHVIGIARNQDKADKACASVDGATTAMFLDLAEWDSVVACAERIKALGQPLDGLITNAGIMSLPELQLVNGYERQFAINHLGHFILINQLRDEGFVPHIALWLQPLRNCNWDDLPHGDLVLRRTPFSFAVPN